MTRTISSQTSNTKYFLTINDQGQAIECSCGDRKWRPGRAGGCKHMSTYNTEVLKAWTFAALMRRYDVRGLAAQAARREAYCVDFAIYG